MENHILPEQLSALVDMQLAVREADTVQNHLAQCGACRALYEELSEVTDLFKNADVLEASPFLWQRISAEITPTRSHAPREWFSWLSFNRPIWVAAGLSIILLGAFIFTAEFRSLQLARQEALDEIETVLLVMNGPSPELINPFRTILTADQSPNPFSMKRLSVESNPFQPIAAR